VGVPDFGEGGPTKLRTRQILVALGTAIVVLFVPLLIYAILG
jgi:hypothetical protein